jgi:hypothetical protein
MAATATLTRPNGKTYRARKPGLFVQPWEDEDDSFPDTAGVIIFGTLDPNDSDAIRLAQAAIKRYFDCNYMTDGYPSWFRNSFRSGQPVWIADAERGRPGVCFTAVR